MKRYALFISDGTGITAETLGQSLLAQFNEVLLEKETLPYVNTLEKAEETKQFINNLAQKTGNPPIIFDTIVNQEIREIISASEGYIVDIFTTFLAPLERELGVKSCYRVGKSHAAMDSDVYRARIDAVNFALDNDDGARTRYYGEADVILVGVSRCGKTPTCLYLALQFGVKAANYPLTEDDMEDLQLFKALKENRQKLFGLTIDVDRLTAIRNERRPNSRYASLKQCQREVQEVEALFEQEQIPYINTTRFSVEEISTRIMEVMKLKKRRL